MPPLQIPLAHCESLVQLPRFGTSVGVLLGVAVAVAVGVGVGEDGAVTLTLPLMARPWNVQW